jgi:hypothetical protein
MCLITADDSDTLALVVALEGSGFLTRRWPYFESQVIVLGAEEAAVAQAADIHRGLEMLRDEDLVDGGWRRDPERQRQEIRLGELLGYPPLSSRAFIENRPTLIPRHWTQDELRFFLCTHGATREEERQARQWTDALVGAFREDYGQEALELIPPVGFGDGGSTA